MWNSRRWAVRARGEVRSNDAFRHFLLLRGVGDVRYLLAPKMTLIGQVYVTEGRNSIGWNESNRFLGGFETPWRRESWTFSARSLMDHSRLGNGTVYNRFRERLAVRWTRVPLKPQLMAEAFTDAHGWAAARPTFAVLVPLAPRVELDMGYHFEFRPARLGGNRQMVYTYLRIRRPGR